MTRAPLLVRLAARALYAAGDQLFGLATWADALGAKLDRLARRLQRGGASLLLILLLACAPTSEPHVAAVFDHPPQAAR